MTSPAQIEAEYKALKRTAKDALAAIVRRCRRVVDLRDASKEELVTMILNDRHGLPACEAWIEVYP